MTRRALAVAAALGLVMLIPGHPAGSARTAETAPPTDAVASAVRVEAAADADLAADASQRVAAMSVAERAATVVMGHVPTTDPATARSYLQSTGIGGFILMGANIPDDEAALRALTSSMMIDPALPPLIAIDEEGGDVRRLPWDDFPPALTLKNEPPAATEDAFLGRGALVLRAGIGVNFGIVADVTADPAMFIYRRALGTTPAAAAERVASAVTGEAEFAASTLKHFPGHGAAGGDSHQMIPATAESREEWETTDAAPFVAGIAAGAPILMFGHLAYTSIDATPASLSAQWHRIARDDLGFTGVSITDDLGMLRATGLPEYADPVQTAVAAIAAGNDMVLTVMGSTERTAPEAAAGIAAAVDNGTLSGERLSEAAQRVVALRIQVAASGTALMPCTDCESVSG